MSAERLIRLLDGDRHIEQRHHSVADEELLLFAADENGYLTAALSRLIRQFDARRQRFSGIERRLRLAEIILGRRFRRGGRDGLSGRPVWGGFPFSALPL